MNERGPDAGKVFRAGVNPDIEIAGGSGNAVDGDRMRSDHEEAGSGRQQLGEEIPEVFVQMATLTFGVPTT